jgi:hypothetical protein
MRAVYVEWADSETIELGGWSLVKEINHEIHVCVTVGWLAREDSESIVVASSISASGDQCSCACVIPKVSIVRRLYIAVPKRKVKNV